MTVFIQLLFPSAVNQGNDSRIHHTLLQCYLGYLTPLYLYYRIFRCQDSTHPGMDRPGRWIFPHTINGAHIIPSAEAVRQANAFLDSLGDELAAQGITIRRPPLVQLPTPPPSPILIPNLHISPPAMAEPPAKRAKRTDSSAMWERNSPRPSEESRHSRTTNGNNERTAKREVPDQAHGRERSYRSRSRERRREGSRSMIERLEKRRDRSRSRDREADRKHRVKERGSGREERDRERSRSRDRHRSSRKGE